MSQLSGGRCRECDATIHWVTTERNGRPMPLDVDPVDNGNIVLVRTPRGIRARVFGVGITPDVPGPRRMSHHATCPAKAERLDPHLVAKRRATRRRRAPR